MMNMSATRFNTSSRHLGQCCTHITERIVNLRDAGAIRHSVVSSESPTSPFQLLEFYGDSVLHYRITRHLLRTRRFLTPHLLTEMRMAVTSNANLAAVFDSLSLGSIVRFQQPIPVPAASSVAQWKAPKEGKTHADVVEAVIGELAEASEGANGCGLSPAPGNAASAPAAGEVQTLAAEVLEDIMELISYMGEQYYYAMLCKGEQAAATAAAAITPTPPPSPPPSLMAVSMSVTSRQNFTANSDDQSSGDDRTRTCLKSARGKQKGAKTQTRAPPKSPSAGNRAPQSSPQLFAPSSRRPPSGGANIVSPSTTPPAPSIAFAPSLLLQTPAQPMQWQQQQLQVPLGPLSPAFASATVLPVPDFGLANVDTLTTGWKPTDAFRRQSEPAIATTLFLMTPDKFAQ